MKKWKELTRGGFKWGFYDESLMHGWINFTGNTQYHNKDVAKWNALGLSIKAGEFIRDKDYDLIPETEEGKITDNDLNLLSLTERVENLERDLYQLKYIKDSIPSPKTKEVWIGVELELIDNEYYRTTNAYPDKKDAILYTPYDFAIIPVQIPIGEQPAYPVLHNQAINGLTKREYFAGLAMQGLLSIFDSGNGLVPNFDNVQYMAKLAVTSADELLKQLETK